MSDSHTSFEARLAAALQPGSMDAAFAARLRGQLAVAARQPRPARRLLRSRRAWAAALVLLALATSLLVIGPQRVLAQVLEWLRYVPGIGFVDDRVGLRVLQGPVSLTRQNLTFTVQSGLIDAERTWLTLFVENIQPVQLPSEEADPGCGVSGQLVRPDGGSFNMTGTGGGGGRTWLQFTVQFEALPAEINQASLHLDCVPGLKEEPALEDWTFLLNFVSAPQDYVALPVIPVPTSQTTPTGAPVADPLGIQLRVENFVELEDGYLFQGVLDYSNSPSKLVSFSEFDLVFMDGNGQAVEVEFVYDQSMSNSQPYVITWSARTARKDISTPLTVTLPQLSVDLPLAEVPETTLLFDFGVQPENGQVWPLDLSFVAGSGVVKVIEAQYISEAPNLNYLTLHLRFEGGVAGAAFTDLDNTSQNGFGGGGGNSSGDVYQSIGYTYTPTGEHRLALQFVQVYLPGPWQTQVELPLASTPQTTPQPDQACLTQELWLVPSAAVPVFPPTDHLLVEGGFKEGVYFPGLLLTNAYGGQRRELGPGGWGALSPDGNQVAYIDGAGLHVLDVATRQDRLISANNGAYSPAWSPSGDTLAFIQGGLWLIEVDGSNERRVPYSHADMIGLPGWLPDGQHLVVAVNAPAGTQIQQIDVRSGEIQDLFLIDNHKGGFTALSPDGKYIAYSGELFGSINYGLYISRLDGSSQQLIARPGDRALFMAGAWSPDSEWLLVNVLDTFELEPRPQHPLAVRPATCEVIPFSQVSGTVIGWSASPAAAP